MTFIKDDKAQAGGLIYVIVGVFVVGVLYVALSAIMDRLQIVNNIMISDTTFQYSQDHWNAMDLIYKFWWGIPVISLIVFVIYGIINALKKTEGQV